MKLSEAKKKELQELNRKKCARKKKERLDKKRRLELLRTKYKRKTKNEIEEKKKKLQSASMANGE